MASQPSMVTNTLRSNINEIVKVCVFELQQDSMDKSTKVFDDLALTLSKTLTGEEILSKGKIHCSSKTGFLIAECIKMVIDFCGSKSKIKHNKDELFYLWDGISLLQQVLTNGGAKYLPGCCQLLDSVFFICFTHTSPEEIFQHQTEEGLRIRYDDSKEYLINQQEVRNTFNQVIQREVRSWIIGLSTEAQEDGLASVFNNLNEKLGEIDHPQTKQAIKWIWFFLLWQEMELASVSNSLYQKGLTNLLHWIELRPKNLSVDLVTIIGQYQAFKQTYNYFFDSNIYWENQEKRLLDSVANTYRRFASAELNNSPKLYKVIGKISMMWQENLFTAEQEAFQFNNFKSLITTQAFYPLIFSILFTRLFDTSKSIGAKAIVPVAAADSSQSYASIHNAKPKFEVQYLLNLLSVSEPDSIIHNVLTVSAAISQLLYGNEIETLSVAAVSCFNKNLFSKQPMQKLVNCLLERIVDRSIALAPAVDINQLTLEELQRYLTQFDNLNILLSNLTVSQKDLSRLMKSYKVREILINMLGDPHTEYQNLLQNKQRFKLLMSDQGIQDAWIKHILTVFLDYLKTDQIDQSKFNFYLDKDDNWLQPSKKKGRLQDIKNLTKILFGYIGEGYPMGISLLSSVIPADIDCSAIREKLMSKLNAQLEKSLNLNIAAAHQTLSILELFGEPAEKITEFRTIIDNKALLNEFVDQLNTTTARKEHRLLSSQSKFNFKQDKTRSYQPAFIMPTSVVPQQPKAFPFEYALPISVFPQNFIKLAKYVIRQHDGALPLVLAGQAIADLLDNIPLSKINDFDCIWYGTPELWQRLIAKLRADKEKLGLVSGLPHE